MSATVQTRVVDLDQLIPRVVKKDIENLIPWVYSHSNIADEDDQYDLSLEEYDIRRLFQMLWDYQHALASDALSLVGPITAKVKIVLPRKNWKVAQPRTFYLQSLMLHTLLMIVHANVEKSRARDMEVWMPNMISSSKYVIGRQKYASMPLAHLTVGPRKEERPIISCPTWREGQPWDQFTAEVLSVMLGQLANNIRIRGQRLQDQEVFVVGFYGPNIYIARGYFPVETIKRVHAKGCSDDEHLELKFTRGYDPCRKDDWLEAIRALSRLFRYLMSGSAKVGAIQKILSESATTVEGS
ncbi:uncharacterized protein BO87DRAFT_434791 [Aspergillus neoniger CBS 115656]|uniref:Uncharacterized protein n=1 Tax=Aspergillus neoniger (strain CBS 115656) TaxID=1448310 RepID=A0A318ZGE6_ASPNB|nr:hypothetical protein BO87DRAFT_434791 [Aspergillus neoniger CBS 115656]PYH35142.1 hypothetical protein BO87DRAFT_434791 [Aspergillus neoniger CBS 115656]